VPAGNQLAILGANKQRKSLTVAVHCENSLVALHIDLGRNAAAYCRFLHLNRIMSKETFCDSISGRLRSPILPLVANARRIWRVSHLPVLLGLLGGAVLAAGAIAPLIHIPIVGTISYLHHPRYFNACNVGELVILAAAALSILFAVLKRFKPLWLTGMVALGQLAATLVLFQSTASTVVAKADQPDLVDPALMWAGAALQRAHFEWGIVIVAVGAVMVLAAAAWEFSAARRKSPG
jgi:hypothetical protein